ncbi:MAG: hypothetical protein RAK22_02030, partial [Nanoarchaeota archaeon]|nr:hypothetical protein [Nanoarchaeota archaeon]
LKEIRIDDKNVGLQVQFVVYSVGVIAVRIRLPVNDINSIERITFDKRFENNFKKISENVKYEIEKKLSRYLSIKEKEAFENYRIYFIEGDASEFLPKNKKWIAGILLDEQNYSELSDDYIENTIKRRLTYYNNDVIIVDWDAAFIISKSDNYENELTVMDTSNVQLLEYRVYQEEIDKMIDSINEKTLNLQHRSWNIMANRRNMTKLSTDISNFYTEYKDMIDSVNKIIMSFGDWYLARLYSLLSDSFKLKEIEGRLENTFDMLIRIRDFIDERISEDSSSFLELVVILLFVAEIIIMIILKL